MANIWVDYLERDFINSEFKDLVKSGLVKGVTTNPSIFKDAILNSPSYQEDIKKLKAENKSAKEIYESLAISDIQKASDILMDNYDANDDGFVSIEVDPNLVNDTKGTIEEGKRLYDLIQRENIMIKVPATNAGYKAMTELMKSGIHVNATLIFSPNQAMHVVEAFEKAGRRDVEGVVSIFVSRFDRKLNGILEKNNLSKDRVGFLNAIKIYNMINQKSIPNVRALFASTGVKQDYLEKDYYVQNLNLDNSVLTLPLDVIHHIKNKELQPSFEFETKHIDAFFSYINVVNIEKIYSELLDEGIDAFKVAFKDLLNSLEG